MSSVILVDDDEDDVYLFRYAFAQLNINEQVTYLNDGEALLRFLENSDISNAVVLLDLNMPKMGGFEVLQQLKHKGNFSGLQIVIYTTSDNPADRQKAESLGCTEFVTKPSSVGDIKSLIDRIC